MRLPAVGPPRALRRWRLLACFAVAGAVFGALIGSAGPPRYESEASVIIVKDRVASDPLELRRFAELASGSRVAERAAALLGGDVPGADLLTMVEVEPAPGGGALAVRTLAESPDYAPAVASAYADAIVAVLGGPLRVGAAASPASERGGRSLPLWTLLGMVVGLLAGAAMAVALDSGLLAVRPAVRGRRAGDGGGRADAPERPRAAAALPGPTEVFDLDGTGAVLLTPGASELVEGLIERAEIGTGDKATLAVLGAQRADASGALAAALAVAAAHRGLHALVVDACAGSPGVAELLRVESGPGLAEYLGGAAGPRQVLRRVAAVGPGGEATRLGCIPAGEQDAGEGLGTGGSGEAGIGGARFRELVDRLGRVYELVVIAGPAIAARRDDAEALARALGGTFVVCGADRAARRAGERGARGLKAAGLHGIVAVE